MALFAPNTREYLAVDHAKMVENKRLILADQENWNKIQKGPDSRLHLANLEINDVEMIGIDFRYADLRCAKLTGCNLSQADFYGADLRSANLSGSYGHSANFEQANLLESRFDDASFENTNFQETHLGDARFTRANLRSSEFKGAFLHNAQFEGANLHNAHDFIPSSTLVRNARFAITADDLWSKLRRAYTGPRFALNLLVLIAFISPYFAKAIYWKSINQGQQIFLNNDRIDLSTDQLSQFLCLANECTETTVFYLLLGFDRPASYWVLGLILLSYNVMRGGMTLIVSPLRDEEERTGYTPRYPLYYPKPFDKYDSSESSSFREKLFDFGTRLRESYGWMKYPHAVVSWTLYIAMFSFVYHTANWLRLPVFVPTV